MMLSPRPMVGIPRFGQASRPASVRPAASIQDVQFEGRRKFLSSKRVAGLGGLMTTLGLLWGGGAALHADKAYDGEYDYFSSPLSQTFTPEEREQVEDAWQPSSFLWGPGSLLLAGGLFARGLQKSKPEEEDEK